jgi:hypothetical protein
MTKRGPFLEFGIKSWVADLFDLFKRGVGGLKGYPTTENSAPKINGNTAISDRKRKIVDSIFSKKANSISVVRSGIVEDHAPCHPVKGLRFLWNGCAPAIF